MPMGRRGRPKSLRTKFRELVEFQNTPAAWARRWGFVLSPDQCGEVDARRAVYAQTLMTLRAREPWSRQRTAHAIKALRLQHAAEFEKIAKEARLLGTDLQRAEREVVRRGLDQITLARQDLPSVMMQVEAKRKALTAKEGLTASSVGWEANARAAKAWARRTNREIRRMIRWADDPENLEPPALSPDERELIETSSPAGFALALGRVEWLFEAGIQAGLIQLCDCCPRRGILPPNLFVRGPSENARRLCEPCRALPRVTRSRRGWTTRRGRGSRL
jgi:hypothetical protein